MFFVVKCLLADNCKKLGLVFDDVVGIIEVINCKDVKVQVCIADSAFHFSQHNIWCLPYGFICTS